jgi:hypothetical protein
MQYAQYSVVFFYISNIIYSTHKQNKCDIAILKSKIDIAKN